MAKNGKPTKQEVASAAHDVWHQLYEAGQLREAATYLEENHGDNDWEETHQHIDVLRSVADEKSFKAFEAADFVDNYLNAEPTPRRKTKKATKKLAVVRAAAATA